MRSSDLVAGMDGHDAGGEVPEARAGEAGGVHHALQLGLRQFDYAAGGAPAWNWLMAASLVVMLPVLVMFLSFQQYFIEGITVTGGVDK